MSTLSSLIVTMVLQRVKQIQKDTMQQNISKEYIDPATKNIKCCTILRYLQSLVAFEPCSNFDVLRKLTMILKHYESLVLERGVAKGGLGGLNAPIEAC